MSIGKYLKVGIGVFWVSERREKRDGNGDDMGWGEKYSLVGWRA